MPEYDLSLKVQESLENLLELEKSGVSILVCGTCLNHYGLLEKKKTGQTTNMLDVVTSLETAGRVITIFLKHQSRYWPEFLYIHEMIFRLSVPVNVKGNTYLNMHSLF